MANVEKILMDKVIKELHSFESEPTIGYAWELGRIRSLDNWKMAKPGVKEMAEAGFYCSKAEHPDTVRCFSCFIELDGWEPTDNPWEEHKKRALSLNPPCKFMEIGKKESELSVDDFLEIQKSMMIRVATNKCKINLDAALSVHRKKKQALKKELQKMGML